MTAGPETQVKPRSRNRRVAGADPDKRHQILEGAHAVFTARGFDAASMSDIAAAANVSKGTLYVYFQDKEHLFIALIEREREKQKQGIYEALADDPDLAHALASFGERLVRLITGGFALSAQRIVLGVAERMPELGREFFERGPMQGTRRLAAFLQRRVEVGELAIADAGLAAAQFIDLCQSTLTRPRLFNAVSVPPDDEEIARVVGSAVTMFLAQYGVRKPG
ncbi:TetR/AcrR family transcriptional regulator [Bosea sp. (in: a-proteobacteria)]|uniref:TetR/AcrR family transcriptional regulator n=1 Tax=Bosea sp. (in: a-proteobacteria) TaxID=1871050 RepID=UPI000AD147A5|nr:TetR/AcrR family transcriptional regulator [Bosea sp. (in: a-proteobacteria)]MBN9437961.1 TetR/AcrR family transcriptional regulator [Bosea sp. (in: a-proteobacteria)]